MELLQEEFVREGLRISGGNARDETALVALIVEQNRFFARFSGKLAALVTVGHGNLKSHFGCVHGRAIERHPALNECAEHGEETTTGTGNGR